MASAASLPGAPRPPRKLASDSTRLAGSCHDAGHKGDGDVCSPSDRSDLAGCHELSDSHSDDCEIRSGSNRPVAAGRNGTSGTPKCGSYGTV